jgi:hypothetical protein
MDRCPIRPASSFAGRIAGPSSGSVLDAEIEALLIDYRGDAQP